MSQIRKLVKHLVLEKLRDVNRHLKKIERQKTVWPGWKKFKELTLEHQKTIANANFKLLGSGSSRDVFLLSSQKVLKLATNIKGLAQNEAELSVYTNPSTKDIVSKIYDYDENHKWLVSEVVRQVGDIELKRLIGMRTDAYFDEFARELSDLADVINNNQSEKSIDLMVQVYGTGGGCSLCGNPIYGSMGGDMYKNHPICAQCDDDLADGNIAEDTADVIIQDTIDKNVDSKRFEKFIRSLATLMNDNDLLYGDIIESHFGKTASGNIVLFDYGLTSNVYDSHYR